MTQNYPRLVNAIVSDRSYATKTQNKRFGVSIQGLPQSVPQKIYNVSDTEIGFNQTGCWTPQQDCAWFLGTALSRCDVEVCQLGDQDLIGSIVTLRNQGKLRYTIHPGGARRGGVVFDTSAIVVNVPGISPPDIVDTSAAPCGVGSTAIMPIGAAAISIGFAPGSPLYLDPGSGIFTFRVYPTATPIDGVYTIAPQPYDVVVQIRFSGTARRTDYSISGLTALNRITIPMGLEYVDFYVTPLVASTISNLGITASISIITPGFNIGINPATVVINQASIAELIPLVTVASDERWVMQGNPITYTFRARYLQSDIDLARSQGQNPVFRSTPLPIQVRFNALNYFIPSRSAYPTQATIDQTLYILPSGELRITRTAQGDTFSYSLEEVELYPMPTFVTAYEEAIILNNTEGVYKIDSTRYKANVPIYRNTTGIIEQLYRYTMYVYKDIVKTLFYRTNEIVDPNYLNNLYSYTEATQNNSNLSTYVNGITPTLIGAPLAYNYSRSGEPEIRFQQFAARMYTPVYTKESLVTQLPYLSPYQPNFINQYLYDQLAANFFAPTDQSPDIDLPAYRYLTGLTTSPAGNSCPDTYTPPLRLTISNDIFGMINPTEFPAPYTVLGRGTYWVYFIVDPYPYQNEPQRNFMRPPTPTFSFTKELSRKAVSRVNNFALPTGSNLLPPWIETASEIDPVP